MGTLTATVQSTNQRMGFLAEIRNMEPIVIDYVPPFGDDQGATPMELLLAALGACTSSGVGLLLRKKGRVVSRIEASVTGDRLETHPTVFRSIDVVLSVESDDVSDEDMAEVLQKAETVLCPVYVMLAKATEIRVSHRIIK